MRTNEQTERAVKEFTRQVQTLYGDRLRQILLYGSYARDEATEDSDIDLAVVLAGDVRPGREIDRMIDIITDVNLEYGVLLSVYPVSESDFSSRHSPLLINVRRGGIPLFGECVPPRNRDAIGLSTSACIG